MNTRQIAPDNEVKRVKFSKDGSCQIAAGGSNSVITIYDVDVEKGVESSLHQLSGHKDCVFDVAWGVGANGNFVVSASHDHTWKYWTL